MEGHLELLALPLLVMMSFCLAGYFGGPPWAALVAAAAASGGGVVAHVAELSLEPRADGADGGGVLGRAERVQHVGVAPPPVPRRVPGHTLGQAAAARNVVRGVREDKERWD